jgi:hypothetical protein
MLIIEVNDIDGGIATPQRHASSTLMLARSLLEDYDTVHSTLPLTIESRLVLWALFILLTAQTPVDLSTDPY